MEDYMVGAAITALIFIVWDAFTDRRSCPKCGSPKIEVAREDDDRMIVHCGRCYYTWHGSDKIESMIR